MGWRCLSQGCPSLQSEQEGVEWLGLGHAGSLKKVPLFLSQAPPYLRSLSLKASPGVKLSQQGLPATAPQLVRAGYLLKLPEHWEPLMETQDPPARLFSAKLQGRGDSRG